MLPSIERVPDPAILEVVLRVPVITVLAFRYARPSTEREPEDVRRS
jgi:hypothetical protein